MSFNYLPASHLQHHHIFRQHTTVPSANDPKYQYIKNIELSPAQIAFYRENGYVVIEDALTNLSEWISRFDHAVGARSSDQIFPDNDTPWAEENLKKDDSDYSRHIFTQRIYLSQLDAGMKPLVASAGKVLGRMASRLGNIDTVRLWHEEALTKPPISNQLLLHYDAPSWSFRHEETLTAWCALDDVSYDNGCLWVLPGSHKIVQAHQHRHREADFSQMNMDSLLQAIPELRGIDPVPIPVKKGSIEFHSGYVVHGSGPNLTHRPRKVITFAMFPDGCTFNGTTNILSRAQLAKLKVGDLLNDDKQNPVLYSKL